MINSALSSAVTSLSLIKDSSEKGSKEVISLISSKAKSIVLQFTNKTNYEFGNLSKKILCQLVLIYENTNI